MKKHFQPKNDGAAKISALLGEPQHVVSESQHLGGLIFWVSDAASHAGNHVLFGGQDNETML